MLGRGLGLFLSRSTLDSWQASMSSSTHSRVKDFVETEVETVSGCLALTGPQATRPAGVN